MSNASVADATEEWLNLLTEAPKKKEISVELQQFSNEQQKQVDDLIFEAFKSDGLKSYRLFNCDVR